MLTDEQKTMLKLWRIMCPCCENNENGSTCEGARCTHGDFVFGTEVDFYTCPLVEEALVKEKTVYIMLDFDWERYNRIQAAIERYIMWHDIDLTVDATVYINLDDYYWLQRAVIPNSCSVLAFINMNNMYTIKTGKHITIKHW